MNNADNRLTKIMAVMLAFFVMGFVDIVGVATAYVRNDFNLSNFVAQFIPFMAMIWFFLLSVPTGLLQDRFGKKRMLQIGILLNALGMVVPFIYYSFPMVLGAFILIGIGNTIIQVSANPLLRDIVPHAKFSSYMSLSQFIKAVSSLLGPIITTLMAATFGNWKLVFAIYAITSLFSALWLFFTRIKESGDEKKTATFRSCFSLLKNPFILVMFIGIFFVVGADVGMNSNIAIYLQSAFGLSLEKASLGISIYFTALMGGRFLGAVLLNWFDSRKFLVGTSLLALAGLVMMLFSKDALVARIAIAIVGLGSANTFPLIFAIAVEKMPNRANEISGLMIMAVSGGALIPPIIGFVSKNIGVVESFGVIGLVLSYLVFAGFYSLKR